MSDPRAQVVDVRGAIDTELDDEEIRPYLRDAHAEVGERVPDGTMSEAKLSRIETYLAAHLIRFLRERNPVSEDLESVSFDYSDVFGSGLEATAPGQTVITLDSSGTFGPSGGYSPGVVGTPNPARRSRRPENSPHERSDSA